MRFALCAMLALSACYAPTVIGGVPCDPDVVTGCPVGQTCQLSGGSHICTSAQSTPDGAIDAPPLMPGCYGAGILGPLCFSSELTGALTITTARRINTAMVGAANCTEIRAQNSSDGPSICIIAASSIEITAGVAVQATGANPLVLVAAGTIKIDGTLDVASHASTMARPALSGPGARTAVECNATGVDGAIGNEAGGGGGAGGSFGGKGAQGGDGNTGAQRGVPVPANPPALLIGGCGGGRGGDGFNRNSPDPPFGSGPGGFGGGAVYVLAGDSITVSAGGSINASGAGGEGGTDGLDNSGGGGGGGAGGMIGLDAPRMTITGAVYANGGGGGGGGGGGPEPEFHGAPGADPTRPDAAAVGGPGGLASNRSNPGGGNGGLGAFRTSPARNGGNASAENSAGAGGGGGVGAIKVYGVSLPLPGGAFSPEPTT